VSRAEDVVTDTGVSSACYAVPFLASCMKKRPMAADLITSKGGTYRVMWSVNDPCRQPWFFTRAIGLCLRREIPRVAGDAKDGLQCFACQIAVAQP
jgi:hypothetical protein